MDGDLNPLRDIETIRTELALADLETIKRREEKISKLAQSGNKEARIEMGLLGRVESALDETQSAAGVELSEQEREIADTAQLLTAKPVIYVANVAEADIAGDNGVTADLSELAQREGTRAARVCAELESELADLDQAEAGEYLAALGVSGSGVRDLIRTAYDVLGLVTFFTGNEKEVRARAIRCGSTALTAAGHVHTDIQRGFIGAEVIAADLLVKEASVHHAREDGKLRLEGRDYEVQDGDVIQFKFNV